MSGFFVYFRAQLRRCVRVLPFVLAVTLLLAVAAALTGKLLADNEMNSLEHQKVELGLVGETESSYLRMGRFIMEHVDTSGFAITFTPMRREEAESGLRNGRLVAYLDIPEGFAEKLGTAEQIPAVCITASDAADVGTRLIDDLTSSVGDLLLGAQNAILGMNVYIDRYAPEADKETTLDLLKTGYTSTLINRTSLLQVQTVGFGDNQSLLAYYLCALLTLFIALWGMSAAPLFARRSKELSGLLTLRGLRPAGQTLAELGSFAILMTVSMAPLLCGMPMLFGSLGDGIPELKGLSAGAMALRALWALPAGLMLASTSYFLYELAPKGVGSVLLQFLTVLTMGYVCGCMNPISFFPEGMRALGEVLPMGVARRMLAAVVSRGSPGRLLWPVLGYTALFYTLSTLLRRGRIRGGAQ